MLIIFKSSEKQIKRSGGRKMLLFQTLCWMIESNFGHLETDESQMSFSVNQTGFLKTLLCVNLSAPSPSWSWFEDVPSETPPKR